MREPGRDGAQPGPPQTLDHRVGRQRRGKVDIRRWPPGEQVAHHAADQASLRQDLPDLVERAFPGQPGDVEPGVRAHWSSGVSGPIGKNTPRLHTPTQSRPWQWPGTEMAASS